jgi:hypothetical protein
VAIADDSGCPQRNRTDLTAVRGLAGRRGEPDTGPDTAAGDYSRRRSSPSW